MGPCDFVTLLFHQAGEGFLSCVLVGVVQPHGLFLAADRLGRPVVRKVQPPPNSLSPDVFPVAVRRSERSTVSTGTIPSTVSRSNADAEACVPLALPPVVTHGQQAVGLVPNPGQSSNQRVSP